MKRMQKRYIFVFIMILCVCGLIWKLSSSYAYYDTGYSGSNLVDGDKWQVNIVEVSNVNTTGDALLIDNVSTIGTTLNFNVSLFKPGDSVYFDFTVKNMGKLDAMLYATTLVGLSTLDSEVINYEIIPLDYIVAATDSKDGSIMKENELQLFRIKVVYDNTTAIDNYHEYNLNLGSTIIYEQK